MLRLMTWSEFLELQKFHIMRAEKREAMRQQAQEGNLKQFFMRLRARGNKGG